jgi:hypothetical protein
MDEVRSYVRLDLPFVCGKAAPKIVPPRLRIPSWKGLGADSGEKHEPASDVDTELVDSLKALDPERPIREADISRSADPNTFEGLAISQIRATMLASTIHLGDVRLDEGNDREALIGSGLI